MTKTIFSILALLLAGGLFVVYTMPTYDTVQSLRTQNAAFDQALGKAKELQDLKQSLLSRYNAFGGDQLDRLNKLLPDHIDNVRLVLDLDSLASRYGIALQNVVLSKPDDTTTGLTTPTVLGAITQQTSPFASITLQFSTETTYKNFVDFLQDLEASLRIVDVSSLVIAPSAIQTTAPQGDPMYRFTVTLRTYWLKK